MAPSDDPTLPPAFDDLGVGVTLHDPGTGAILDVNEPLEELYGYPASRLREMDVGDLTPEHPDFSRRVVREGIRDAAAGESGAHEWRVERATGERLWVRARLDATTIDGTECVLAEIRDITGYKARERRLRLLNRVLRHNLRNETTVLMGYAERLRDGVAAGPLEDDADELLEIVRDIEDLSESVRQLQAISAPEAGRRSPTRIGGLLDDVVAEYRERHPDADVRLDVRDDARVNADVGLEYALAQAVENAIEHNDASEPSVVVTATRTAEDDRAVVSIADDGPPIPEIEIEALDEDTETTSTYHGSGLGLWVMQWCVDAVGGDISFERGDPGGNVVRFHLPTVPADDGAGTADRATTD